MVYLSSNGAGMGHLTRLLAMARRHRFDVAPYFVSMSQAVPVVESEGFDHEYIPSRGDLGVGPRWWNAMFARRLADVLRRERPEVLVFDGTYPYEGLLRAREALPGLRLVWSRRGMWLPGRGAPQLARASVFDAVVEPGELAAAADRGATAGRADARVVGPVTLLDDDELVSREDAARVLGVDPSRPTAMVTLGAGTINDISSDLGRITAGLADVEGLQILVTRPVISDEAATFGGRVSGVSVYPISRYLACVDLAVAASGYNAFHELVGFGVPTAFVPNTSTAIDDQLGRARWAEDVGAGLCVDSLDEVGVAKVVTQLGDPSRRARLVEGALRVRQPNGAAGAQDVVEEALDAPARSHA